MVIHQDCLGQAFVLAQQKRDFAATVDTLGEKEAGYAVTYIECETEKPDVIMAVASNDEGRIYFNGVDIYVWGEPRTLTLDADKGRVTLNKASTSSFSKSSTSRATGRVPCAFWTKLAPH